MFLKIGDLVGGRFRLEGQVGAGGMGVVYRAADEQTGTWVALKILEGRTPEEVGRARLEAASLSRCSHPAIAGYIDHGELPGGGVYLAMAWIDGVTLAARLAGEGLSLRELVVIARRIADALATTHRARVLHRDIKPSNILLAGNDPAAATLIDFGVARLSDAVHALTRTGAAVGTPGYMAPEQARGQRDLTPAADVFGLGCVLYECATAQPAFSGSASAAVLLKILFATPPLIVTMCPEAPPELAALIDWMLAKNVDERLADGDAVLAALDRLPPIPDGPRRSSSGLIDAPTIQASPAADTVRCIIGAARGRGEDILDPPSPDDIERLRAAAASHGAAFEVLATGAVAAELAGSAAENARRAADLAIAMREILPGWSIAISSVVPDVARAADTATLLLDNAVTAAIFRRRPAEAIAVDRRTARLLESEFVIEQIGARETALLRRR